MLFDVDAKICRRKPRNSADIIISIVLDVWPTGGEMIDRKF